ncbi:MAG TPA: YceI family protein [Jiangellales bacterium]|nr:YceI family protein [Jiangellales bacterium]
MTDTLGAREWQGTAVPTPGTFVLDPSHTTVGFVARHLMVTKVRGHFAEFEGSITVGEDPLASSAQASIATASLTSGSADRDGHVKSADFLAVEEYPRMTFVSRSVSHVRGDRFTVVGDLTVKDVTRPVELDVTVDGVARDPWGGERLAVTATAEIDREEFGITWNVALESGGVLVSKKVKIEIEAQAVRQV